MNILTAEDGIKGSNLTETMQKAHIDFCRFLTDNGFSIEPEKDGNGWQILYKNELIGHMNFSREFMGHDAAIWIDTCDFGGSDVADDALKETAWAHVRVCEHFSSGGTQCGCGRQPGFSKTIFGKNFENLCFALLGFMNPDAKLLEDIKKLMLLFKQNRSNIGRVER